MRIKDLWISQRFPNFFDFSLMYGGFLGRLHGPFLREMADRFKKFSNHALRARFRAESSELQRNSLSVIRVELCRIHLVAIAHIRPPAGLRMSRWAGGYLTYYSNATSELVVSARAAIVVISITGLVFLKCRSMSFFCFIKSGIGLATLERTELSCS